MAIIDYQTGWFERLRRMQIAYTCAGCGQEVPWCYWHDCGRAKRGVDPGAVQAHQKAKPKVTKKLGGFATLEEP